MQIQAPLRAVTPTLDGDVLGVLASAAAEYTAADIVRVLDAYTVPGVKRVLRRLVEQGVVVRRVAGRTAAYRLNREHLAADAIIALASIPQELHRRLRLEFTSWPQRPVLVALFGSAARREMRPDSDIDLFLVRPDTADDRWDDAIAAASARITAWTGNDTRFVEWAQVELDTRAREPLLDEIVRDGVPILGDWSAFRRRVRTTP